MKIMLLFALLATLMGLSQERGSKAERPTEEPRLS